MRISKAEVCDQHNGLNISAGSVSDDDKADSSASDDKEEEEIGVDTGNSKDKGQNDDVDSKDKGKIGEKIKNDEEKEVENAGMWIFILVAIFAIGCPIAVLNLTKRLCPEFDKQVSLNFN
jgi:hypothetical protein